MRVDDSSHLPLQSLLTDRLGRWGVRSAQIIVVVVLAAGVVYALVQVKLVAVGWTMIKAWDGPDASITKRAKFSFRSRMKRAQTVSAVPLSTLGGQPTMCGI